MNKAEFDGITYFSPSQWNEMESYHLIKWIKILSINIDMSNAIRLATIVFYRLKPKLYFKLNSAQQVQLIDTLFFLATPNTLTKWLIPKIDYLPWLTFYGPDNSLSTSSIHEFGYTEKLYVAYTQTKNEAFLDQLIATLYRKKGKSSLNLDERVQLSQKEIMRQAPKMSKVKKEIRQSILFNYEGCRAFIFKRYPTVFKIGKDQSISNKLPELENLVKTVAGGKFGNYLQTEDTPIYTFFDHLADEIEFAEKNKKS